MKQAARQPHMLDEATRDEAPREPLQSGVCVGGVRWGGGWGGDGALPEGPLSGPREVSLRYSSTKLQYSTARLRYSTARLGTLEERALGNVLLQEERPRGNMLAPTRGNMLAHMRGNMLAPTFLDTLSLA